MAPLRRAGVCLALGPLAATPAGRAACECAAPAAGAGVIVQVRCPPDLTPAVDADLIRQAVDDLVDNALRFAPAGSQVDLVAAARGADVTIAVAHAGAGFPAARVRAGGAGLGLAIVAAIARAHGGTAVARNRPGGGAEVALHLPGAWLP